MQEYNIWHVRRLKMCLYNLFKILCVSQKLQRFDGLKL